MSNTKDIFSIDTWCPYCKTRTEHITFIEEDNGVDVAFYVCDICNGTAEEGISYIEEATLEDIDILRQQCSWCENSMVLDDTGDIDDYLMCVKDIDNPKKVPSEYICLEYEGKIYK